MEVHNNSVDDPPLADLLSRVIRHPGLPQRIRDVLMETLNDVFNAADHQDYLRNYESSPEYLSVILEWAKGPADETLDRILATDAELVGPTLENIQHAESEGQRYYDPDGKEAQSP